jgi:hypothetical protein
MNEPFDKEDFLFDCALYEKWFFDFGKSGWLAYEQSRPERHGKRKKKIAEDRQNKLDSLKKELASSVEDVKKAEAAAEKKLGDLTERLKKTAPISPEYYPIALSISKALKTGRAINLPSAINIVLSDERAEKEEKAAREHDRAMEELAKKQLEAQNAASERQEAELKRHNEEMEKQSQAQTDAINEQNEIARETAVAQAKAQAAAERKAQSGRYKCVSCSKLNACLICYSEASAARQAYDPKMR